MRFFNSLAGRLSQVRRSRLAAPALLMASLLMTGGIVAVITPASATKYSADADAIAKGRALFLVGCSSCHGKNAEGIQTQGGGQYGPSLVGVGAAAVHFQMETGRMPMANPGVQAPRKTVIYNQDEIDSIAAFIASVGPGPAEPTEAEWSVAGATNEQIVRGGELFRTNCTACHNFAGSGGALPGGKLAPALTGVAEKHIYEAMLTGPQQMPVFSDGVMTPQDKRDVIAYLKSTESAPGYGGTSMGALGPVAEGVFVWIVGLGALVGFAVWIAAHTARTKKGSNA